MSFDITKHNVFWRWTVLVDAPVREHSRKIESVALSPADLAHTPESPSAFAVSVGARKPKDPT